MRNNSDTKIESSGQWFDRPFDGELLRTVEPLTIPSEVEGFISFLYMILLQN